eukprot:8210405-Pyramimonas_sp.AAC.1
MVTVICNGHVDSEWKIMRNSFEPSLKHTTSHTSGDVQQRFSNRWTEVRDDPIECAKRAGRRLVYAYFVLHLRLHLRDTAFKLSLGPCLLPGGDSCAWNYPSASFIRHENIPALPACDWSTMRIYPRFLSLIGTILRVFGANRLLQPTKSLRLATLHPDAIVQVGANLRDYSHDGPIGRRKCGIFSR